MDEASAQVVAAREREVDAANAHAVTTRIRTVMLDADCYDVVTDLTLVEFIDSTGLDGLIKVRSFAAEHGGSVSLTNVQPQPTRAMQLAGLSTVLPIK